MGDRAPGVRHDGDVARRVVGPRRSAGDDRVAEDRVRPEHAEIAQPGDRRLAVARQHLVELDDRLRRVHGVRATRIVRQALRITQQIAGARVDLRRRNDRAHEIAVGAVVLLDELGGLSQALPPCFLVPFPDDAPPVAREPAPRAEREPFVDTQTETLRALGHRVGVAADVQHGGDTAAQQLGHREVDAGERTLEILRAIADRQVLEQP